MSNQDEPCHLADLLSQIASGDTPAWAKLSEIMYDDFVAIGAKLTGDAATAGDIAQDALIAIKQSAHRFSSTTGHPERDARRFCTGIAAHKALTSRRRTARLTGFDSATWENVPATQESCMEPNEHHDLLRECIAELREPYAEALVLHHLGGLSRKEVALKQDVSENTVHTRIWRGLRLLKHHLEKRGLSIETLALLALLNSLRAETTLSAPEAAIHLPPPISRTTMLKSVIIVGTMTAAAFMVNHYLAIDAGPVSLSEAKNNAVMINNEALLEPVVPPSDTPKKGLLDIRAMESGEDNGIQAAYFSEDRGWLLTGDGDNGVSIWDVKSQARLGNIAVASDRVVAFASDPRSGRVAFADGSVSMNENDGGRVTVFSRLPGNAKLETTWQAHPHRTSALTVYKGDLWSAGSGSIKRWHGFTNEVGKELAGIDEWINAMSSHDGFGILVLGNQGSLQLIKNDVDRIDLLPASSTKPPATGYAVAWKPDGTRAAAIVGRAIYEFDMDTNMILTKRNIPFYGFCLTYAGDMLCCGGWEGKIAWYSPNDLHPGRIAKTVRQSLLIAISYDSKTQEVVGVESLGSSGSRVGEGRASGICGAAIAGMMLGHDQ